MDALCKNKPVSLTRISTTRTLIEENRSAARESCSNYRDSLEGLDEILAMAQSGKICNLGLVDLIRKYHERFIASPDNRARSTIPTPLRHFFISFCFQISAECKMALINNLEHDTRERLTDADYAEIRYLEHYGAAFLDSSTEIGDFDDILLLSDLNQGLHSGAGELKLLIKVRTSSMMRALVDNCNRKFKPLYDKLIMPLIQLSNMGYNYQGELLERELAELKQSSLVRRWYNIVQTCETFRTVQIFEDPDLTDLSGGRRAITFISGGEAQRLRQRNVKTIEQEIVAEETTMGNDTAPILDYDPIASHNDDELWIKDQDELEKLVQRYRASSSEADRVRWRLFKRLMARVRESIMSGKVLLLASELVKSGFGGEDVTSTSSMNEEVIMMVDQAIETEELQEGGPNSGELGVGVGGPVAGLSKKKVVSRYGPASHIKSMTVPNRIIYVPIRKDGTKSITKMFDFGAKFLPRRMTIFMMFITIIGFLFITIAVFG